MKLVREIDLEMATTSTTPKTGMGQTSSLGEYTERVLNYNVDKRRRALKKTQKELMEPMGVSSEGAVSQRLRGTTHWTLISAVNVAQALNATIEELLDDAALKKEIEQQAELLRLQLEQINMLSDNKKAAAGDTRPRLFINPVPPVGLEPTLYRF